MLNEVEKDFLEVLGEKTFVEIKERTERVFERNERLNKTLGAIVSEKLETEKVTLEDLGLDSMQFERIKEGRANLTLHAILMICDLLNVEFNFKFKLKLED